MAFLAEKLSDLTAVGQYFQLVVWRYCAMDLHRTISKRRRARVCQSAGDALELTVLPTKSNPAVELQDPVLCLVHECAVTLSICAESKTRKNGLELLVECVLIKVQTFGNLGNQAVVVGVER